MRFVRFFAFIFLFEVFLPGLSHGQMSCRQIFEKHNIYQQMRLIHPRLEEVVEPINLIEVLLGPPQQTKVTLSIKRAHFDKMTKFRPVLFREIKKVLSEQYGGRDFRMLSSIEQRTAVQEFIKRVIRVRSVDELGRNFFEAYFENWIFKEFKNDPQNNPGLFLSFKKISLSSPHHLNNLFSDIFIQLFRFDIEHLRSIHNLVNNLWGVRRHFNMALEYPSSTLTQLSSFDPMLSKGGPGAKRFSKSAGIIIYEMMVLQRRIIKLESQLLAQEGIHDKGVKGAELRKQVDEVYDLFMLSSSTLKKRQRLHIKIMNTVAKLNSQKKVSVWRFLSRKKYEQTVLEAQEKTQTRQVELLESFGVFEDMSVFYLTTSLVKLYQAYRKSIPAEHSQLKDIERARATFDHDKANFLSSLGSLRRQFTNIYQELEVK